MPLAKNRDTLTEQLAERLRTDIRRGVFVPGSKLPSERQLSAEFGVCRVTVIEALKCLTREGVIEKIPLRGSFVIDHSLSARVILLYPEEKLGLSSTKESTFAFFEFHRGLLAEAARRGVDITVSCFPEHDCSAHPGKYLKRLEQFDAVIFPSPQLLTLRRQLYKKKRLVINGTNLTDKEDLHYCTWVKYNQLEAFHQLLKRVQELGWEQCVILSPEDKPWYRLRSERFQNQAKLLGLEVTEYTCTSATLPSAITQCRDRFVFFNHTMLFSALYQACAEQNLVQGRDFMLAGLCSGGTLSNLSPAPSYLKIPHYDLGVVCLDAALNTTPQIIEVNATLIENSTLTSKPLALKI